MTKHPIPAVIAVVVRDDKVLLAQRRNEPDAGLWGFPGGKINFGEAVEDATLRELREETGIAASIGETLTTVDVFHDQLQQHFVLVAICCHWTSGDPIPGDDAMDARWFEVQTVLAGTLNQSARVAQVLALAQVRAAQNGNS
ncbi:MAG: NUDIX hydrolase [Pseudomonadota bacterium]